MVSEKNKVHSTTAAVSTITLAAIGILLGNLAGIGFILGMIDALSCQIAAILIAVFHVHTSPAQFCVSLGIQEPIFMLLLGVVISPIIMSVIARRWIILWSIVPTVIFGFWTTADYMSANSIKFSLSSVVSTFFLDNTNLILIGVALSFVVYSIKRHFYIKANV